MVFIIICCMIHKGGNLSTPLNCLLNSLTADNRNLVIGFLEAGDM